MKRILIPFALAGMLAVLGGCVTRTSYTDLYGSPAAPASYLPTIVITPTTKYVNVVGGDTVRFVSNGKAFAWTFNVARTLEWFGFDLNEVTPPGFLDHQVHAYVSPDPKYIDRR